MRRKFMSMALTAAMVLSMAATPVFKEHEPGHWAACHLLDK